MFFIISSRSRRGVMRINQRAIFFNNTGAATTTNRRRLKLYISKRKKNFYTRERGYKFVRKPTVLREESVHIHTHARTHIL